MDRIKNLNTLDLLKDYLDAGIDPKGTKYAENGFNENQEWYRKWLEEYEFYDFEHVIDIGCGYGRWSFFLAEGNKKVTGYDNSAGLINIANNLNHEFGFDNLEFYESDAENLPLMSHSVDAAFVHSVTFRIGRKALFGELHRVLKDNGVVFVGAFNSKGKMIWRLCTGYKRGGFENNLFQNSVEAIRNGPFHDGSHTYATKSDLDGIMDKYGFKIDRKYPVKDLSRRVNSPIPLSILDDLDGFLDSFMNDEAFRQIAVKHMNKIMQVVEYDLYFRLLKK